MQKSIILKQNLDPTIYPNASENTHFNFNYNSIFYEYIWYQSKRWELSSPFHLADGEVNVTYRDTVQKINLPLKKGRTSILISSASVNYKLTRWLAIGGGFGYRLAFSKKQPLFQELNAPIYVFRVKILMGELLKMWFRKGYVNYDWDK